MTDLTNQLNNRIQEETEYMSNEVTRGHNRMAMLEEMLKKERDDRIESLETQLQPIRKDLTDIQNAIDAERTARVQKEREILEVLHENS